ncbi:MAG: thioesterase family protein [Rhodocyclaceae bacterium]|jgi:acyl-CoA thioesterase-2|nr:thioesterase family protein [Rhodocyclaceae bacterium]
MYSSFSPGTPEQWDGVNLETLLGLERIGEGAYRSRFNEDNRNRRVFGGQLIGQALRAAQGTVAGERLATALQVLFLQGGLVDIPIDYRVTLLQEGRRFSSRRIEASQGERRLLDVHATFQVPAEGITHALPPHLAVPGPDHLLSVGDLEAGGDPQFAGGNWQRMELPSLELKVVNPESHLIRKHDRPEFAFWVRLRQPLGDDPALHAAALAYLSDYRLNSAALTAHIPIRDGHSRYYVASLNHSLWLHRPCRADDWLLFSTESPAAQGERGLTLARLYDGHGLLVASASQECLIAGR